MRLTTHSDYALRVLMYLAVAPQRLATIQEIAGAYGISENHLMKVVHRLSQHGLVETIRGRGGGVRLGRPAADINIASVLRAMEEDFTLVECFGTANCCKITSVCRLKHVLHQAMKAYLDVLSAWTLEDLVAKPRSLAALLGIGNHELR